LNTPQTTTVPSSVRLDGEKAFTTYQGGTTGERFVLYLKDIPSDLSVRKEYLYMANPLTCAAHEISGRIAADNPVRSSPLKIIR
jgi:hypothetical protein